MNAFRPIAILILSILSLPAVPLHAGVREQASSAAASLRAGHPIEALETYRTLLTSPQFATAGSPELWYDRGLAEERTGDAAAASLSFRRALLLDPGFPAARRQLALVLGTLGLPAPPDGWRERLHSWIHPERLILAGVITGWSGGLLITFLLLRGPRRKGWIALSLVLLIGGHGASVFGTMTDPRRTARDEAVVTAKTGPVLRATPADSGTSGGTLSSGTLISVLSRNGAWWYVSAGSGLTGWIHSDTVAALLPPSPARE